MIEHPIPQHVTGYEFHLIGNMTIKQFLEVGIGVAIAIFFYASTLPDFARLPLIVVPVLLGAAIAFLPFDGRPLDRMIVNFFHAVYSPTQYIWRKTPTPPDYFSFQAQENTIDIVELEKTRVRKNLKDYLRSLPEDTEPSDLDQHEQNFITSVDSLFNRVPTDLPGSLPQKLAPNVQPKPKIRVRKIKKHLPQPNRPSNPSDPSNLTPDIPQSPALKVKPTTNSPSNSPLPSTPSSGTPPPHSQTISRPQLANSPQPAKFNPNLPLTQLPSTPNTLTGMIYSSQGKLVENAIVEVRDRHHLPVRALKTNRLGQFFSATGLPSGTYELEIEHPDHKFSPISLDLSGQILPPLEIQAHS